MIIDVLGDSITAGCGASSPDKNFVSLLRKKLGCTVNNYGVGGTRIARQRSLYYEYGNDHDFVERMTEMDRSADFVFVFGGTNDYAHGDAPVGDIDDNDEYTFYGALNTIVKYVRENIKNAKLCFILPMHRLEENYPFGENGCKKGGCEPLVNYVNAVKAVCARHDLDHIDLFYGGFTVTEENKDEYTSDGLHPNDKGHEFIADKVAEYVLKNSQKPKIAR